MYISKIGARNFKSFDNLKVELGKFNVLVGSNASGKSNFVDLIKFIKNLTIYGLEDAFQMMGGIEFVQNLEIGKQNPVEVFFTLDEVDVKVNFFDTMININKVKYNLGVKSGKKMKISKDEMNLYLSKGKNKFKLKLFKEKEKLKYEVTGTDSEIKEKLENSVEDVLKPFSKVFSKEPIIRSLIAVPPPPILAHSIGVYNFEPKDMKCAVRIGGKAELEENGGNLPIILQKALSSKNMRDNILYLLKDFIPFVEKVNIEKFIDKSAFLSLKEEFYRRSIPASLISEGTLNILATIVALIYENKSIYVFEEPERNIHPTLIEKLVNMIKDFSRKKQIILTTHNPLIVKYSGIDHILLVKRDKNGFSHIVKPKNSAIVNDFLRSDFGLDELFVKDIIGAGI